MITYMKPKTKEYAPAKCAWCEGSGRRNVSPGNNASCIVCGGKGQVSIVQPMSSCSGCEGTGKRGASGRCMTCTGKGWEHTPTQG